MLADTMVDMEVRKSLETVSEKAREKVSSQQ
jgi:hypothetical protein